MTVGQTPLQPRSGSIRNPGTGVPGKRNRKKTSPFQRTTQFRQTLLICRREPAKNPALIGVSPDDNAAIINPITKRPIAARDLKHGILPPVPQRSAIGIASFPRVNDVPQITDG